MKTKKKCPGNCAICPYDTCPLYDEKKWIDYVKRVNNCHPDGNKRYVKLNQDEGEI